MLKSLFTLLLLLPLGVYSQLSFRTGAAFHMDYFPGSHDAERYRPYSHFLQYSIGAGYQRKDVRYGLDISVIHDSRHLEGRFGWYKSGQGGTFTYYQDDRIADAAFSYLGFRPAIEIELIKKGRFSLFFHLSQHMDVLIGKSFKNRYQTTSVYYSGDPPSVPPPFYTPPGYVQNPETKPADFSVLSLDKLHCYPSIGLIPSFRFGPVQAELSVLLNCFMTRRVVNYMKGNDGDQTYDSYPTHPSSHQQKSLRYSTEIGLRVVYTLGNHPD